MKAIRVSQTGGPEVMELADVDRPVPGPGQILLKQTFAGINYADVGMRMGRNPRPLPFIIGREGAGTVEAVGPGVIEFKAGDRAAYSETPHLGGYAEYNVVPVAEAVPVPPEIEDRTAAATMLQGLTAHYLTNSTHEVGPRETILVHAAAGGVGLLLVQLAKARGATVIGTAGGPEKCALAKEEGADHVIDYVATDFAPEVRRLTNDRGVDVVYDAIGAATYERSMSVVRRRGLLVLYGAASGPVPPFDTGALTRAGSLFLTRPTLTDYKRERTELLDRSKDLFNWIAAGKLKIRIGASFPLAQAAEAHWALEGRQTTGKVLLAI
jgi:NADPH2:quinone reductase